MAIKITKIGTTLKKIIIVSLFLLVRCTNPMHSTLQDNYLALACCQMEKDLEELGLGITENEKRFGKNQALNKSILTPFWQKRKEVPQGEKNLLLQKILRTSYPDQYWCNRRIHIAAAIMIGADPNTTYRPEGYGDTALDGACSHGDLSLASFLLAKGAWCDMYRYGCIPFLYRAFYKENKEIALLLLDHGAMKQLDQIRDFSLVVWCNGIQKEQKKNKAKVKGQL